MGGECDYFTFRTFKLCYVSVLSVQKHLKILQKILVVLINYLQTYEKM